jgi:sugar lactone lactonase YvrE
MRISVAVLSLIFIAWESRGHPGIGIVQDSRGTVYFTDLKQVWKIAPDGKMSVAVPNVHTHELCLDAQDNLYGEHLSADADKWSNRVWRMKPNGALTNVIPLREGLNLLDYSFVRDRSGSMYWADPSQPTIKKRLPHGIVTNYAAADFRMVQRMTATPEGILFLMDGANLRRVFTNGQVTTLRTNLSELNPAPANVSERNYHMGLWTDRNNNVYVAVAMEHLVMRVQPDGQTSVAARSSEGWSPSGGMFDRQTNLWLLEYDSSNAVRARQIRKDGSDRIFAAPQD